MKQETWAWNSRRIGCRRIIMLGWIAAIGLAMVNCGTQRVSAPAATARISPAVSTGLFGSWDDLGYQVGDIIADFVLYSENGKQFRLSDELKKDRPVVFSGASYTCDISRGNFPAVRNLWKKFGHDVAFYVVYTTEAHPADVPSPYSPDGRVWIAPANERDKIEENQPKTYKERTELSRIFRSRNHVPFEVLVDSPDNYFWRNFGQAPNMLYVILPDGKVYFKQTWFEKDEADTRLSELLDE